MAFGSSTGVHIARDEGAIEFRRSRWQTRSPKPGNSARRHEVLETRVSEPRFARFSDHLDA